LPKTIIDQCGFTDTAELSLKEDGLLIRPHKNPRDGWDQSFKEMAAKGDDRLLVFPSSSTEWDEEEWEWK